MSFVKNQNPTIKPEYANTIHRDGTVSYWSVFRQTWHRSTASSIPDNELAAMNDKERSKIARVA